ncbi:MAG: Rieske 2Fe-2S domain-containing protein [Actinomycetota bacterium]|nr:Rieske 2Fe-2S domain-containing protein [Actinomycetota bacterium]
MEFVEVGSADTLGEGAKQAVEVSGKRVVVLRVEGKLYAMGAICTHERANLDEGTLMGHELYCPLHFSCFDVRTGEAMAPPADRDAAVYAVKVEDGKLLVSSAPVDADELETAPAAEPAYPPVGAVGRVAENGRSEAAATEGTEDAPTAGTDPAEEPAAPAVEITPTGGVGGAAAAQENFERREDVPGHERAAGTPPPPAPTFEPVGPIDLHAKLFYRLEGVEWLETGAQRLGAALRPIREGERTGKVFELLHGRMTGHALHPAMTDLPLGMWTGQMVLDALGEHSAAGKLGALGVLGGLGAAVTGAADWTVSDGGDRRVGLLHGLGQTAAIALHCTSLLARARGRLRAAQALAGLGTGTSIAFAYLGGHLVLGKGVMVDHTAWNQGPRAWSQALRVDDLAEGEAKAAQIDGRAVLVSRIDGAISAIDNVCSHAGAPLSTGRVEDGIVTCPWHGSRFKLSNGACVRGPANHPQPLLEARERGGWVEVRAFRRR